MAFAKAGYGQVEPNHLSAMRTGQIYAQLPVSGALFASGAAWYGGLENGTFAKYDPYLGYVCTGTQSPSGEYMLVMNEVKLYDVRQFAKDFIMNPADYVSDVVTPRLYKTNVGDIITTNQVLTSGTYTAGDVLKPATTTGILYEAAPAAGEMAWQVVKVTTMPDGSPGLKLQRIQ